jgi:hypothetical protein
MIRISSRLQTHGLLGALAALVLTGVAGCSGHDPGDSVPDAVLVTGTQEIGTVVCGKKYLNQSTSDTRFSSYGCLPSLVMNGTEWVQSLTATTAGDVVVSVTDFDAYPFIAVLRDNGTGIDPSACIAVNYYSVRFLAGANEKFYVVVDTDGAVPTAHFDANVECAVPATEQSCGDGFDNDGDLLIDCADPDCETDAKCSLKCMSDGAIACGETLTASTSGFGTTNVVTQYSCPSDRVANNREHAHTFRPTQSGWVNFTLSDFGQYPMLFVLEDDGTGCNPNRCVAHNYYSVRFYATAGKTYYLVVDGWGGTPFSYHASVVCDPPATEANCSNGIDDDGDTTIDCADEDCAADSACQSSACVPTETLSCSTVLLPGDTAATGSTNAIGSYSCSPDTLLGGRERAYTLGPVAESGPILVTASNFTTYPLLAVLEDKGSGCSPMSCVAEQYYSVKFPAKRGKTYYVVVEGDAGEASMQYDLSVVCKPPGSEVGLCADGVDNDGDMLIDCRDPDCASACAAGCTPAATLPTSVTLLAGSTSASGASNVLTEYGCYPNVQLPGNEYAYRYTAAETGPVLFALSDISNYATLTVLEDQGDGCNANACVAFNYYSVVANLTAGRTYYVVVDGDSIGTLEYKLSVIPNPPANESGLCSDNVDNDADFLIDSLDPDCSSP